MSDLTFRIGPELVDALSQAISESVVERLRDAHSAEPSAYLDVEAAARYLACEKPRIYDLVSSGRLRCAKDGRRSLFRQEWLDECLNDASTG